MNVSELSERDQSLLRSLIAESPDREMHPFFHKLRSSSGLGGHN